MLRDTVLLIPGTAEDDMGNIYIAGKDGQKQGPRQRFEFIMSVESTVLQGVRLPDLLNWLRWGSQTGVMWEFQLEDMIALIEKWEEVNDNMCLYIPLPSQKKTDWETLWKTFGQYGDCGERRLCTCGRIYRGNLEMMAANTSASNPAGQCECGALWYDTKPVFWGPRGQATYNLVLNGGDGYKVAAAAYYSRGQKRPVVELPSATGIL